VPSLEEKETPEFAVIKLTYTTPNPETMVVILPHTSLAFFAVLRTIWLLHATVFAKSLFRHFHLGPEFN
jgi:hypothetical protein